jgi:hypothetical protein
MIGLLIVVADVILFIVELDYGVAIDGSSLKMES